MKNTYDKFTELCSLETQELIEKFKHDYKEKKIKKFSIYEKYINEYPNIICIKEQKDIFIVKEKDFSVSFAYNHYSDSCAIRYIVEKNIDKDHKINISFGNNFRLKLFFACFELFEKGNMESFYKESANTVRYAQEYLNDLSIPVFEIKRLSTDLKKYFTILNDLDFANMLVNNYFELSSIRDIVLLSHDIDIEKNPIILSIMENTNSKKIVNSLKA